MKQSTSFAQVATDLLNVLQGYTKGIRFLLVMFLTLTVSAEVWGADFEKYSGTITEGDYLIVYDNGAMKNTVSSSRLQYTEVTVSNNKISNPDASLIWHIAPNGNYWTIYNANVSKYAAGTGAKSKAQLLDSGTDDKSLWTVSGTTTYEFVNKANKAASVNSNLRRNTTYGFACYATSTGGALTLYKKVTAVQTVAVTGVSLNKTSLTLTEGSSETLTASVSPDNATDKTVTWSTSDANFATVSDGKVTAVAEGSATITVKTTDGNKTATCKVTVNPKPTYTVKWYVSGAVTHSQTGVVGTTLTNIPNLENYECGDKVFVGWITQSSYEHATDAPTGMITSTTGMTIPENGEDYYAVFATRRDDSGSLEEVFYTNTGEVGTDQTTSIVASGNINTKNGNGEANCIGLTSATNKTFTFSNINTSNYSTVSLQFDHKIGKYTNYPTLTISCGDFVKTIQGSTGKYITALYNDFPIGTNLTLTFTISAASGSNYSQTYLDNISFIGYNATTTYSDYTTSCTTETSYSVTSYLSHVTADPANPTTVLETAEDLNLAYEPMTGWNLPATISVTMGGNPLILDDEYTWDKETGKVWIVPDNGFTGDMVVTINGWQQLATPTNLSVTDIISTSATLSWDAVENASSYTVELLGENKDPIKTFSNLNATTITISDLESSTNYILGVVAVGDGSTYLDSEQTLSDVFTTASATCTVTYDANGGKGTITDDTEYTNGATVTVLGNFGEFTNEGYAFTGWNTKADGSGDSYKHNDQFTITTNTTLYAQWCKAYWKLVTEESKLENDTRIVIAAKDEAVALSITQNASNRGQAAITKKYNTITFGVDVQSLGLVGLVNNEFALYDAVNNGYLYAASSTTNQLKTGGNSNKNGNWDFSISKDGTAYINARGTNTNNQLKYNAGSDLFSCYGSGNSQKDVVIYKEVCVQDQYKVASTLTNATAVNTNPITVASTATTLTLKYSANTRYLLPETITVKMGGVELLSGTDYTWNKETGVLAINVDGFFGDIDVKIVAEEDPCYGFAMSEVTATSTTTSITLTWTAVDGATGYNVKIGTGEFTAANGLTHTFEGLSPKTSYNWEVQAVKEGLCEASKTGSTTTQKETFIVSWIVNGNTESPYATESVVDGNSITQYPSAPSAPSGCREKVFVGWTNKPINTPTNETPAILYKQKSDIPEITETTTLHAVWADEEGSGSVGLTSTVSIGDQVVIVNIDNGTTELTGFRPDKTITDDNNYGTYAAYDGTPSSSLVWTVEEGSTASTFAFKNGSYYLNLGVNDNNLSCSETKSQNSSWTITESDNRAVVTNAEHTSRKIMWNQSSPRFACYNKSHGLNNTQYFYHIAFYRLNGGTTYSAYTTLCDNCTPSKDLVLEASANTADLDINGKATITFSTTGGNGGAITYTANPKNGVSWENGVATFTKSGEYEITATQEKNGNYCPTVSNTLDVTITAIPHLYFTTEPNPTTIVFDPVECGGNTRVEDKKSVSVQAYNLAAAVTVTVTGPYKIARTSGATLNEYDTKLTLDKNQEGHINGNYDDVYILSFPPAGSSEPTEGTLTFTTTNGNELTVSLSTPTITCTPCTLTFNDRGIKTTQEYYAGTEVPEPATPTGVCGEYEFDGWALAKVERGSTTYEKVTFPFTMPANNQTVLHAVYRHTEGPTNQYELVTEIESGKDYVIAAYDEPNDNFALTNSESSTTGKFTSVRVECDVNNIITTDNANIIWTVTGNDAEGYKFYNSAVKKYIEMYRSDGKSLLRLVDNCTNTFDVNIEMDENDKVYVDITSPEVDENYNVFSFYLELFNVYTRCDYNIYFYEQTATSLYTTTPDCHPSVTLTSDGEVYVTATNGRGIMAATPLTLTTTDLAPNTEIAISSNSSDIYFSTERNTNFAMAAANQPQKSLTLTTNEGGELEKQLYIHYKPSADGDGTPAEVVVTADVSTHNPPFTAQKTIHVRNLPAKFVIATKAGATWYALPANMSGATNPAAVVIEVDETTMTATAPNTIPYTLFPVKTTNGSGDRYTQYGDRVRFSAINYEYRGLWANNNATEQTIRNFAVIDAIGDDGEAAYEWKVATTVVDGNWQYTLYSDQGNNKNHLCYSMNQENPAWGTYASNEAQYQLYFLPIKAETTPFDYQVVEWYPNKVLIQTSTVLSSLTAKIAGEKINNVTFERKDANQYEVTGLPLLGNPTKALTLEFVLDAVTHSGTHTIPVMLSGGNHSVSTLAIGKGIYNYTNLVVRDGATLTVDGAANTDNTFYDVTIYPTAKISVPEGKQLSVHRMTFFGGISEIYNGSTDEPTYELNKYGVPQLSLKGTLGKTVTTMDYIMRVNLDQMYQVGVPYDVNLDEITYWDGSAIILGDELFVSAYDGQARANLDMNNTWRWEVNFDEKVLKAGVGYTISAEPQVKNDDYSILRMPMKSNISSGDTEASKQVPVIAYANQHSVQIADNHKGWNYLSNPYMTAISGGDADSKILLGALEYIDGSWELVNKEYRYVTIPHNDGEDYDQQKFSEATLLPFKSFFLQIAENGDLSFALASRQAAPARYLQQAADSREVEFEILLANATRSDNMGLLISEEYTPDYEINADLEKMIGSMSVYSIYNGYNLAYNAINPTNAHDWIPIGYSVPDVGEYTFSLDEDVDLESVEHIYLIDYETSEMTDLVEYEYTFQTSEKKNDARFAIQVRLSQKHDNTTTVLDNLNATDNKSSKFIYNEQLYILRNGNIYDATGQFVTTINK